MTTDNEDLNEFVQFNVTDSDLGSELFVVSAQGHETISQLFECHIVLQALQALEEDSLKDLLQKKVVLDLRPDYTKSAKMQGIISSIEVLTQPQTKVVRYVVVMRPRLWFLSLVSRSRVFLAKSVKDIIADVLKGAKFTENTDFEWKLQGTYRTRDYTLQYEETDLQFISRLMEEEGIYYYFKEGSSNEVLVMTDAVSGCIDSDGSVALPFSEFGSSGNYPDGAILEIHSKRQTMPKEVHVRNYRGQANTGVIAGDPTEVDATDWPADRQGTGQIVIYGERVDTTANAKKYGQIRAEELASQKLTYHGQLSAQWVRVGQVFSLEDHFYTGFNKKHLVTSNTFSLDQEALLTRQAGSDAGNKGHSYHSHFDSVDAAIPYRPLRLTPKPKVEGLVHGVIDSADTNTLAPIDDKGRYYVVFPFDTVAPVNGQSSCPVTMVQSYGGPGYGIHFPLHKGTVVVIAHLYGDPDRPVIVGAFPNQANQSPVTAPNKTLSAIQTRSAIRIEFEDDA